MPIHYLELYDVHSGAKPKIDDGIEFLPQVKNAGSCAFYSDWIPGALISNLAHNEKRR